MTDPAIALATWLLLYLLHSTLLLGAVALVERLRLVASPAIREHLWRAALVGALLTATAQTAGLPTAAAPIELALGGEPARPSPAPLSPQELTPPVPPVTPVETAGRLEARSPIRSRALTPANSPTPDSAPAGPSWRARLASSWPAALLLLWILGAAAALTRLTVLARATWRELGPRRSAGAELRAELEQLCRAQSIAPPALSISAALASPISLPNREIVLPPWAVSTLDRRQRRALLAHELAHQARRDPQWILFALLLDAVLWPQPLHRIARRRLAALAEIQADAWAARAAGDPRALAECLVECAERLLTRPVARFGAAMAAAESGTPLLDRIERLTKGTAMHTLRIPLLARGAVAATVAAAAFLLPGCGISDLRADGSFSSHTRIDDDGDLRVSVSRPGYRLKLRVEGEVTFAADESDVERLSAGGELRLDETRAGTKRAFEVVADASGALTRTFERDGRAVPADEAAKRWLAEALPRMFRESGFDAEARVGRLLARGGVALVLDEVALVGGDFGKGSYLGHLLARASLSPAELDRALAAMSEIGSDFELRQALERALSSQSLDGARFVRLLELAGSIGSDFECAELLVAAIDRLPDDAAARGAWLAAARGIDSDFERGRAIGGAIEAGAGGAPFAAELIALAAAESGSDFELRQTLGRARPFVGDPAVADAYLRAVREIDSDFERREALSLLLQATPLDDERVGLALDAAAEIDSSFERLNVLERVAGRVAGDAELTRRYRELARSLDDHERGEALRALDDATPN